MGIGIGIGIATPSPLLFLGEMLSSTAGRRTNNKTNNGNGREQDEIGG